MLEIVGTHNTAKVFIDTIDPTTREQILTMCSQEYLADSRIRVMPDTHAGKGCTIGTTMTLHGKVVPNMVGVDIGCGMEVAVLEEKQLDLEALDRSRRNGGAPPAPSLSGGNRSPCTSLLWEDQRASRPPFHRHPRRRQSLYRGGSG